MTRIFLIRHAEAEGNIYRRTHGHFNGQVTGRGFTQIGQLKERFLNEKFDAVYSSDLSRTKTTAAAICEPHGLPLNTSERLREVNVGEWEDMAWGEIKFRDPEMYEYFESDPARWIGRGSENYSNVRERMKDYINEIGRLHEGGTVAVFSHGFAIRAFLCEIMGIPSHKNALMPYCDNTAVTLLRYEDGGITVEYYSDNSHLSGEASTFAKQTWWRDKKEQIDENLRYLPFDGKRDAALVEQCGREAFACPGADIKLTAFLEDKPVGILWLDTKKGSGEGAGWISRMYIMPELRRAGLGVQLLGEAIAKFRKLRRETLRMEAAGGSPEISFCAGYGFNKVDNFGTLFLMEKNIRNWE